jgi:hypothetical protein
MSLRTTFGAGLCVEEFGNCHRHPDPANKDAGKPEAPEYFAVLASWLTRRGLARAVGR